jgi:phage tail-like protein
MRGLIPVSAIAHPVVPQLPGVYQGETVVEAFCAALDEVLAPAVLTLDSMPAYLDPQTTPPDMLAWLAAWLGISVYTASPIAEQRALVRDAVDVLRWRGTAKGLRGTIRLETGLDADIVETGATEWSSTPETPLPGAPESRVIVRITATKPDMIDVGLLDKIVSSNVPAHVSHRIEVIAPSTPTS